MNPEYILAYTDGAVSKNGKEGAVGGMGVYFPSDMIENISETYVASKNGDLPATNNRTEFIAIYLCIQKVYRLGYKCNIAIVSDSLLCIRTFLEWLPKWKITGEWKSKKNIELILKIQDLIDKYPGKIMFLHIRGHGKEKRLDRIKYIPGNKKADELAVSAKNL